MEIAQISKSTCIYNNKLQQAIYLVIREICPKNMADEYTLAEPRLIKDHTMI